MREGLEATGLNARWRVSKVAYASSMSRPVRSDDATGERFWRGVENAERFFMVGAGVHKALEKLVRELDALGVPYAIIGAMALNEFGYERVTVDVDLLLTAEGLGVFKAHHLGRGYVEKFPGSRGLRDPEHGVDIDVVLAGSFPGDGRPKPVVFPDPGSAAVRGARIALLPLPRLIELKLASGMTAPHRLRDLADVLELVRVRELSADFATELNPYVREKYLELWRAAQGRDPDEG
jgi:hypothetical protein